SARSTSAPSSLSAWSYRHHIQSDLILATRNVLPIAREDAFHFVPRKVCRERVLRLLPGVGGRDYGDGRWFGVDGSAAAPGGRGRKWMGWTPSGSNRR